MDFYTGKPDRAIKHYGVIHYTYQTSQAAGFAKVFTNMLRYTTDIEQQSDEDALLAIENLVLEKQSNANVIYDMNVSMVHIPIQGSYCIITKIFASYGAYQDVW
ncbi:hypothetical protein [Commensalibacter communis]|uniref:hypothetical protein n=1 Tax=Commensalibacter communis TaxID=2972786 RepID=UPI0022FFA49C|nr:hypothetical protein [Commensalibacter communis]CAI3938540.1 unnamed protein product [Commensalibacter communis]CAI3939675.1 unnamed protein product [Commensalibacter communis]